MADTKGMVAWAIYDWSHNAFGTVVLTFVFSAYFTRQIAPDTTTGTALWGNTVGIATFIVAVLAPFLGALADKKGRLKPWVAAFTLLCAAATAGLWFVKPSPESLVLALALVGVGTLGAHLAFIFYNAMLPHLVPPGRQGGWSGWGWGLGYFGGLACLTAIWFGFLGADPVFVLPNETGMQVRAACLFTAGWLVFFSLPLILITPDAAATGVPLREAVRKGLVRLGRTVRQILRCRPLFRFFVAHMLYIDALAAVFVMGGVFAGGTVGMDAQQVLLFGIALNISAGVGAFVFAVISHLLSSRTAILLGLVGLMSSALGMLYTSDVLMAFWLFGLLFGVFVGPVQAASRSFLAEIAPEKLRAQMFGFYALSGKATSFAGPLAVGWISYWTGSQVIGMSALLVFFTAGFALLLTVPNARQLAARISVFN
ncbi:MFS transporter [Dichotomicrobium thermohalophilum]|uniref:UMF1 family MFS transporter n=1 Tax=Dichotomicrobium thermohalophilum TaxID=933063 RepID=A0A397Q0E7_9HYPH|nr:MFS transporter [Dichotomicrobium thermohalophilum]RIA54990.1 UMF1 family MFS transporter [Dichotomicrobium thermohalophilum]